MYVDGIYILMSTLGKDINVSSLTWLSINVYGWIKYKVTRYQDVIVYYNPSKNLIKIKGSIPYFHRGHNFFSSIEDFRTSIQLLSELLEIDLRPAEVKMFEFGTVLKSDISFSHLQWLHISLRDFKVIVFDSGKYFVHPNLIFKLYNAEHSIQKKVKKVIRDELKRLKAYDQRSTYVKLETKYKNPQKYFGHKVTVANLLNSKNFDVLENELMMLYDQIKKRTPVNTREDKYSIVLDYALNVISELLSSTNSEFDVKGLLTKRVKENIALSKHGRSKRLRTINHRCSILEKKALPGWSLRNENIKPYWFVCFLNQK